jgi:hypothetical protein
LVTSGGIKIEFVREREANFELRDDVVCECAEVAIGRKSIGDDLGEDVCLGERAFKRVAHVGAKQKMDDVRGSGVAIQDASLEAMPATSVHKERRSRGHFGRGMRFSFQDR